MLQLFNIKKIKRSFTLIELLVVMATIGLLASIILVSLAGTREKARDIKIVTEMTQMRTVAAIINLDYGTYDAIGSGKEFSCDSNATEDMRRLCDAVDELKGPGSNEFPIIFTSTTEYCAYIELLSGGYFCIEENVVARSDEDPGLLDCSDSSWNCSTSTTNGGCH